MPINNARSSRIFEAYLRNYLLCLTLVGLHIIIRAAMSCEIRCFLTVVMPFCGRVLHLNCSWHDNCQLCRFFWFACARWMGSDHAHPEAVQI
jgi:hypothetical protein